MKQRASALSLLFLMIFMIFLSTPTLAHEQDNSREDGVVAPSVSFPVTAVQAAWDGRWPWTSQRLIHPEELLPLSPSELELMRNEIYARHGWIFRRPDLRNYFESQPWYRPRSDNAYYSNRQVEAELSPIERRNLQIINSREKELGR
jgi:hypothetical protein